MFSMDRASQWDALLSDPEVPTILARIEATHARTFRAEHIDRGLPGHCQADDGHSPHEKVNHSA